ncbi:pyridoxamine 5'-phosphate oxidase [Nocardioides panacihumi]|uniref:Pyridoxine/pyridoxamine 5'-phosphate oxidase n=1 Tax=Nocardioides panacihumi TaxID=400774 RepID=A0ABN2QS61_9ACTN
MTSDDLASRREDYARGGLAETDLTADPLDLFRRWYADSADAGLHEPNAMAVATATPDGAPSVRFVLLKGFSPDGFVFYTNLTSRKGHELLANPRCALLFPWHPLERQVRVEGHATELPRADVDAYFASRPRGSQLGAWASHQSTVVSGRAELDAEYAEVAARFDGGEVPTPDEWGGFRVRPDRFEFWQGRTGRMHDRLTYRRTEEGWETERLAP